MVIDTLGEFRATNGVIAPSRLTNSAGGGVEGTLDAIGALAGGYAEINNFTKKLDDLLEILRQNEYHNNWLLALEIVEC